MLRYDLDLDVDYGASTFAGTLTISDYPPERPVELDLVGLEVDAVDGGRGPVAFHAVADRGKLRLELGEAESGPIRIRYHGRAGEKVQTGLFVSHLGDRKALSTQMEPEGCRRFLPCFDRPDRKAEFALRVTTAEDLTVISNTAGSRGPPQRGRRTWTFERSPPMATYLLYVGVGPFEEASETTEHPPVVIAGPPGSAPKAAPALRDARATLRALAEYFGVPYPLSKLHLVALSDFWVGMENWGAITGSEEHYLYGPNTPPAARRFAQQTVVHEISHQWFGDLVTLKAWNELWLNEAFATFITARIGERAGIRQDPWAEFVLFAARGDPADSLESTHPVKPASVDPQEIMATADMITYFKGARLIRMIEAYLGEEAFRRGLATYLRRHRFGSAESGDLWRALEESSGHGVVDVMRAWVERPGLPVIEVRQDGSDLVLAQRRFTYLGRLAPEPPWPIPLRVAAHGREDRLLFDTAEMRLRDADGRTARIDPQRPGFFRLLPQGELRNAWRARLAAADPLDRWAYLHDARAFLLSGDFALKDYLDLVRDVRSAEDLLTIEEVTQSVFGLGPVLRDAPGFAATAREFTAEQLDRLGERPRSGEPEGNDIAREWLARIRVRFDDDYARALAARFATVDREAPAFREAISIAAARYGSPQDHEELLRRTGGPDGEAALQACHAIEGLPSSELVIRFLDHGLEAMRMSDLLVPATWGAARNPTAGGPVWDWLRTHLRELERRAEGSYLMTYTLDAILPWIGVGRDAELRAYFAAERFPSGSIGIRNGLEVLEAVGRLRARSGLPPAPGS